MDWISVKDRLPEYTDDKKLYEIIQEDLADEDFDPDEVDDEGYTYWDYMYIRVIVTIKGNPNFTAKAKYYAHDKQFTSDEVCTRLSDSKLTNNITDRVIAWMIDPEPYEGD